jgi:amino acid transporter
MGLAAATSRGDVPDVRRRRGGLLTAVPGNERAPGLARGTLTTVDAVAISVTILAPGMAMLLNVPGIAAVTGGSTPAAAGYAYTYISRSPGRTTGFVAGWLYAFGVMCFVPSTMAGVAYLASDLLHLGPGWWFPLFLLGMALLVALSIVRIKVTTRLQLAVGAVTVAAHVTGTPSRMPW